ncbi:universal stress protein [Corynebacterium alimapuense]|uniref:Universal stress protein n=1 Tax=Corynebacterium alimapuense TaxID=1576874 RepID=A0A3M8K506_9CORY|nr:universal stress protein [Corynebacterium alimapuense]RNE48307.1 universal stress protein [Corynebacterium alimapuense]
MITYSTIAVGTDGSESSLLAVRTAASLARVYDANLVIISAWYAASGSLLNAPHSDVSVVPIVGEDAADSCLQAAHEAATEEGATSIELRKVSGAPATAMTKAVIESDIDLLVIGNKGVNTLTGRVFGNIPTEVVRRSPVNVLIVNTDDRAS